MTIFSESEALPLHQTYDKSIINVPASRELRHVCAWNIAAPSNQAELEKCIFVTPLTATGRLFAEVSRKI
jgi:hypothetical protein